MRDTLSKLLVDLAEGDPNVVLLTGDHGYALFDEFRKRRPKQYLNAGIAEQNMVGVAAGLAKKGFRPIVYGLSAFVPIRVLEQIKIDVAHDSLPVIFLGDGAGFVYSYLGTSHQSTEDIAALRAIPNLDIYSPADRFELISVMKLAADSQRPGYVRIGKADLGDVHTSAPTLNEGKMLELVAQQNARKKIVFVATGSMVKTAMRLASEAFPGSSAWSIPTVSDEIGTQLAEVSDAADLVVTLEEHSKSAGLGGLVSELLAESNPTRVLRIGTDNKFSKFCGSYEYLLQEHRLDFESVVEQVNQALKKIN